MAIKKYERKCNEDCFHCEYDDCILTYEECGEIENRNQTKKSKSKYKPTDWKDPEQIRAYHRAKYYEHKEREQAYKKEYYKRNRERFIRQALESQKRKRGSANGGNDCNATDNSAYGLQGKSRCTNSRATTN